MLQFKNKKTTYTYHDGRMFVFDMYVNFVTGVAIMKSSRENAKELAQLVNTVIRHNDHISFQFYIMANAILGKDVKTTLAINPINLSKTPEYKYIELFLGDQRWWFDLTGYPVTRKQIKPQIERPLQKIENIHSLIEFLTEFIYQANKLYGKSHDNHSKE